MEEAKFNRTVRLLFIILGTVDVIAGSAVAVGASYFGFEQPFAWAAGGIFALLGIGMLAFVHFRG